MVLSINRSVRGARGLVGKKLARKTRKRRIVVQRAQIKRGVFTAKGAKGDESGRVAVREPKSMIENGDVMGQDSSHRSWEHL